MSKFDPTVAIVGRVGRDPEVKQGAKGDYVTFSIARDFRDRDGQVTHTAWYRVNIDGSAIPSAVQKGQSIEVRGTMSVKPGDEKDGSKLDFYSIRSTANDISAPRMGKNGQPLESITISGRVGREPETLVSKAGREYHKFSMAHNYSVRDESGEWGDYSVWYNVLVFTGEPLPEFVKKGALVEIRGVDSISTYFSKKLEVNVEDRTVRAFELSVPDNAKAVKRADASVEAAGSDEEFKAPF